MRYPGFHTRITSFFLSTCKYANHVAVVQSAGTGKSRMVHEASREVFGIIFNFGSDESDGEDNLRYLFKY